MDPLVWTSGGVSVDLAQECDWLMLRSVAYGFAYDSEPVDASVEASMWWRHLWGMVVTAHHGERFLGYIRNGYSSPSDLLTRLQAGVVSLKDAEAFAIAVGLYLGALMWHMPVNRVYVEIPSTPDGEAFASILAQAGFQSEGRYRRHRRVDGSLLDVLALGFLRRDLEASPLAG